LASAPSVSAGREIAAGGGRRGGERAARTNEDCLFLFIGAPRAPWAPPVPDCLPTMLGYREGNVLHRGTTLKPRANAPTPGKKMEKEMKSVS